MFIQTDPTGHPSLVLVEALDLGQVGGRGALDLETLLGGITESWVNMCPQSAFNFLAQRHIYQSETFEAIIAHAS